MCGHSGRVARRCDGTAAAVEGRQELAMIEGTITTKHVLRHPLIIINEFGVATFLRCVRACLGNRPTTFLALVANCSR
jgi:hypothetical protein